MRHDTLLAPLSNAVSGVKRLLRNIDQAGTVSVKRAALRCRSLDPMTSWASPMEKVMVRAGFPKVIELFGRNGGIC